MLTLLRNFPANREKYREFMKFWSLNPTWFSQSTRICWRKGSLPGEMEQGVNRTDP